MQSKRLMLMLCSTLGLALVSGCGTTRASYPPAPAEIPLNPSLMADCEAIGTPLRTELPALAPEGSDARRVQLEERAFWMEFDLSHNGVEARACARYLELRDLIVAYNAAARATAEGWPR